MDKGESIYKLLKINKDVSIRNHRYKSKYPPTISPTASTFLLKNTSFPNVSNIGGDYSLPRGAHPINGDSITMGKPLGFYSPDPKNYHKKGMNFKILPPMQKIKNRSLILKPSLPLLNEKSLIKTKVEKNYILSNAIDNILLTPKVQKINNNNKLLLHRSFGKVPNYIKNYRKEFLKKMENNENNESKINNLKILSNEDINKLKEGLTKKWNSLNLKYGKISHKRIFDSLTILRQ